LRYGGIVQSAEKFADLSQLFVSRLPDANVKCLDLTPSSPSADHPNRRHWPKDYAVWEIHPVMKIEAIRN
jgi:hypothetical protein